jgi:hypothetical protein
MATALDMTDDQIGDELLSIEGKKIAVESSLRQLQRTHGARTAEQPETRQLFKRGFALEQSRHNLAEARRQQRRTRMTFIPGSD